MNKLIVLFGIFFFISCGKEYDNNAGYDDPRYSNDSQNELFQYATIPSVSKAFATKNVQGLGSISWTGNSYINIVKNKFLIYFETINNIEDKFYRELLAYSFIPMKEGCYSLKNLPGKLDDKPELVFVRTGDDGDVVLRGWYPSQYNDSYIKIEKIDSMNKKIYVSFDAYLDYENENNRKAREKGSEFRENYWSKSINFLGGRAVLDFPK